MIDFLCKLWPYLAGGLIGWLLAGWFARRLKHSEPPIEIEKIVEKTVDNPQHLSLISRLETENKEISGLKTKLSGFESATPKRVDNPAHLKRITDLEAELQNYKKSSNNAPQTALSGATKTVDNPAHLKRITDLEAELENYKKSSNNKPQAATSTEDIKASAENKASISKPVILTPAVTIDKAAAKAAGFRVKGKDGRDDFTIVEGIGPKINDLIHDANIHTYTELGGTKVEKLQQLLDAAGSSYRLAKPGTWPAQADMAAANKWDALKVWQDELTGDK